MLFYFEISVSSSPGPLHLPLILGFVYLICSELQCVIAWFSSEVLFELYFMHVQILQLCSAQKHYTVPCRFDQL